MSAEPLVESLDAVLQKLEDAHGRPALERVRSAILINTGRSPLPQLAPQQRPRMFFFPGLSEAGWFNPDAFEETRRLKETLEREHATFLEELLAVPLRATLTELYAKGSDGSEALEDWGNVYLVSRGAPVARHAPYFPRSSAILASLQSSLGPGSSAVLNVMGPHCQGLAHTDTNNVTLSVQLGLLCPEGAWTRVTDTLRPWRNGSVVMFNDTFLHQIGNDSAFPRLGLVLDVWHPELTLIEREAILSLFQVLSEHLGPDYRPPWG